MVTPDSGPEIHALSSKYPFLSHCTFLFNYVTFSFSHLLGEGMHAHTTHTHVGRSFLGSKRPDHLYVFLV